VVIGIDADVDGRFDRVARVFYEDLRAAMEASRQREARRQRRLGRDEAARNEGSGARTARRQPDRRRRMAARGDSDRTARDSDRTPQRERARAAGQRQPAKVRISGTVAEATTFRMAPQGEHRFAKLKTDAGRSVPVDLGRLSDLESLGQIKDGDQVTVIGSLARVNDRRIVRAERVRMGGETATIATSDDRDVKRVRGKIRALRTARFKGQDQPFQVARVDLRGGRNEVVILGPEDRLETIELESGDEVQLLVRRARYNGNPALVADQVRVDGQLAEISKPEGKAFQRRKKR
jgi:hypothetical protein